MKTGDRVLLTTQHGSCIATVEHASPPEWLPELPPPAPPADISRQMIAELGIDSVLTLSYQHSQTQTLVMIAIHVSHPEPGWRNLRGEVIEIEPAQIN